MRWRVLLVLWFLCGSAAADVRIGASVHGTLRAYTGYPGDTYRGVGPGLSFDAIQSHRTFAQGLHLGWHTYDEDEHNGQAHTRMHVVEALYYIEHAFAGGGVGCGIGLDHVRGASYDITGGYSYTNDHTMIGFGVQLALDVITRHDGSRLGIVSGFAMYPLVDVLPILSDGDVDLGWRGITASLGVYWQSGR